MIIPLRLGYWHLIYVQFWHCIISLCAINSIHSHLNVTNPLFKLNTYLQNLKNKNKDERKNPMNSIWSDNTISNWWIIPRCEICLFKNQRQQLDIERNCVINNTVTKWHFLKQQNETPLPKGCQNYTCIHIHTSRPIQSMWNYIQNQLLTVLCASSEL